jgi:hypothetical protein
MLQRQLIEARRKHRSTKHIHAQIRAITEMHLRGKTTRLQ